MEILFNGSYLWKTDLETTVPLMPFLWLPQNSPFMGGFLPANNSPHMAGFFLFKDALFLGCFHGWASLVFKVAESVINAKQTF